MVRVALYVPAGTRGWGEVDFVIDTGASISVLHPADAIEELGIDPARLANPDRWTDHRSHRGVGGAATFYLQLADYSFLHAEGHWQSTRGHVSIAQSTEHNQRMRSLLGWDILQHFSLHLDWSSRRVTLS